MREPTKVPSQPLFLVDDEQDLLEVHGALLSAAGYTVETYASPRAALEAATRRRPFLVVSDYRMPEMDGLALCQAIRAKIADLPFVLLTGYGSKEVAIASVRSRVSDILEKPLAEESLLEVVRRHADERLRVLAAEAAEAEELRRTFLEEARLILADLEPSVLALEARPDDTAELDRLFRKLHTIKGSAKSLVGMDEIGRLAHAYEDYLAAVKKDRLVPDQAAIDTMLAAGDALAAALAASERGEAAPPADALVRAFEALAKPGQKAAVAPRGEAAPRKAAPPRAAEEDQDAILVKADKLDEFMKVVGELVAFRNFFRKTIAQAGFASESDRAHFDDLEKTMSTLSTAIQARLMDIRKAPLRSVFTKFPRTVREMSAQLGKDIRLVMEGEELAVDKTIARALSGSLIHVVRNACDHGIESTEKRLAAGKPARGTIKIAARATAEDIFVVVEGDGGGINRPRVLAKAKEKGIVSEEQAQAMSDEEVCALIFAAGFSTAEQVSDISGRGVGMDAVRTAVEALGGRVRIASKLGEGTTIELKVPVPRSVMVENALLAASGGVMLALPLACIDTIETLEAERIVRLGSGDAVLSGGRTLPLASYAEHVGAAPRGGERKTQGLAIVLRHKDRRVALRCERVIDQMEVVVKDFDDVVGRLPGLKGTAVVSEDAMAYVLSAEEFLDLAAGGRRAA